MQSGRVMFLNDEERLFGAAPCRGFARRFMRPAKIPFGFVFLETHVMRET